MEGMSEREYSAHSGLSRGAVQKAGKTGRLVLFTEDSTNASASDERRDERSEPACALMHLDDATGKLQVPI